MTGNGYRSEGWFVVLRSAGTADEFALEQVENDVPGLAMARATCPVVAGSVVAESIVAESDLARRPVVADVEGDVLARRSWGTSVGGSKEAPVVFPVEIVEVVAEVFFEDADGCLAA